MILYKGGQWFADLGVERSGGEKLFSVSGHVNKPGNYEVPMGIPFKDLLAMAGGVRSGRRIKAVIPGGSSVAVVPGDKMLELTMDFTTLNKNGTHLGSGAVVVMDDSTDMVKVLQRLSRFYHMESCGQCTPCREGTGWLYRMLTRMLAGKGRLEDIERLSSVATKIEGRTICALGDAAAVPVQSFIRHFRPEFEHYVQHGCSMLTDKAAKPAMREVA